MDNDLVILNNLSVITGIMDTNSHDIFTGGNWSNDGNFNNWGQSKIKIN